MLELLSAILLAAALLPWSTAAADPRRAAVLLIPLDENAHGAAARFTEYLEDAVSRDGTIHLQESAALLGDSTPRQAMEARKRVLAGVAKGRKLLMAGHFEEADSALRSAMADAESAAAAMERCGEYCDLLAYLSSVQLMKGEEEGAREALKQLLGLEKGYKLEGPAFGKSFQVLLRDVQRRVAGESLLGSIAVQTDPPGGRVFLDGASRGYAPVSLDRIPVGRHLLRIERAGFITYGQMVDVSPGDEAVVRPKLTPTTEFGAIERSLEKVAEELDRGEGGAELMKLGAKLKVDRALVGVVRTAEQKVVLECALADFGARRKLGQRKRVFEGEEYGELQKEVERFGNLLLADGESRKREAKSSSDPLDSRTGTEDWDEERSGRGRKGESE